MIDREEFERQIIERCGASVNLGRSQTICGDLADGYISPRVDECWKMYQWQTAPAAVPEWEREAKRAFWAGLEIGAVMGSVPIEPRWDDYIQKRKSEIAAAPTPAEAAPRQFCDEVMSLKARCEERGQDYELAMHRVSVLENDCEGAMHLLSLLEVERDELAARCERLYAAASNYEESVDTGVGPDGDEIFALRRALEETPAESLARVRSDAIENAADKCAWYHDRVWMKVEDVLDYAQSIRQSASQAGGEP